MTVRRKINVAVAVVGAIAGFALGGQLFEMVMSIWEIDSMVGFVLTSLGFAILFGVIAHRTAEMIIIIGTSFIGAYIFMKGWAKIFGGYPDE